MMETPKTLSGEAVEMVMVQAVHKIEQRKEPKLTIGQYNAIYSAVLDTLTEAWKP